MRRFFEKYKYLLIGLLISVFIHGVVFFAFSLIKEKKQKKKEEKPIYISIIEKQKPKKKNAVKKKMPKAATAPLIQSLPKPILPIPKKNIVVKKVKHKDERKEIKKEEKPAKQKKKEFKKKNLKKIKKKIKKIKKKVTKKPKKQKKKKIVKKKVAKKEKKQPVKTAKIEENPVKKPETPKPPTTPALKEDKKITQSLSLADLKGKDNLFEIGNKTPVKKENKVSEEDIWKYIKALERYLNNLARRKDLYPPMAKRLRLEGSLTVRFTIKKDGSVDEKSIKIMVSSGYSILDKGAVKLIKKYVPLFAKREGKKPPRDNLIIELPVTFEIIGW